MGGRGGREGFFLGGHLLSQGSRGGGKTPSSSTFCSVRNFSFFSSELSCSYLFLLLFRALQRRQEKTDPHFSFCFRRHLDQDRNRRVRNKRNTHADDNVEADAVGVVGDGSSVGSLLSPLPRSLSGLLSPLLRSLSGLLIPIRRLYAGASLSLGPWGTSAGTYFGVALRAEREREGEKERESRNRQDAAGSLARRRRRGLKRTRAHQSHLCFSAPGVPSFSPSISCSTIANNQVNARDFPRPDIDNSGPFIEAAQLSSSLAASTRPAKPLKVVIVGAGEFLGIKVVFRYFVSQWMGSKCRGDPSDVELWEDLEGNWRGGNRRTG